jgi:hypothetical protein
MTSTKKTYFVSNVDSYGQRTGTYRSIELSEDEIRTNCHGWKMHNDIFLYESELEILTACQYLD